MKPLASILISSYNRINLLRRTLASIARNPPNVPYEVVLSDDASSDDILGLLKSYTGIFPWVFVRNDNLLFEQRTGIRHFFNNPAGGNNSAFANSSGKFIFLMGNEIIAVNDCFNRLLNLRPIDTNHWIVFSTTLDMSQKVLDQLDETGSNLSNAHIQECSRYLLNGNAWHSDVTNYLSVVSRATWQDIGGYNEEYKLGISAEDSDFIRRARTLPDFKLIRGDYDCLSLHQYHGGVSRFYQQKEEIIKEERMNLGRKNNRLIYDAWKPSDGPKNPQTWEPGKAGVVEVITSE